MTDNTDRSAEILEVLERLDSRLAGLEDLGKALLEHAMTTADQIRPLLENFASTKIGKALLGAQTRK